jgi:hypothetical protein
MDVEQINNFMSNSDREEVSFSDAQWLYLPDSNQGSYNNILQFYTTPLKQQFIDYHNAYLRIPVAMEFLNTVADGTSGAPAATTINHRPPTAAFRKSVLSLFSNINVATDQGQTIVNDINTQFVNNIRLDVENDEGWIRTEGSYLDYSYDRFNLQPSQNSTYNSAGYTTTAQTSPCYWAPQGIETGNLANAPLVNDPNQYGNNTLGTFTMTYSSFTAGSTPLITAINGIAIDSAAGGTSSFTAEMSDGRVAVFPYSVVTAGNGVQSIGGVPISGLTTSTVPPPLGLAVGATYTVQALGTTNVLDQPLDSELVTVPLTFTVITSNTGGSTAGTASLTGIGGVTLALAGATAQQFNVYGQIAGLNPNANMGFLDRIVFLQNASEYVYTAPGTITPNLQTNPNGAHTYYYRCIIPLKLLHDFFRQLDFPIINVGFNFQFTFAQSNGANVSYVYPPIQTSNNTYLITGGADNTPYPSLWYGRSQTGQEGTRLYYRVVKFSPADNVRTAEKLTTGFTKSVKFISTDWFREPVPVSTGTATHQFQFSTSVVHPLRVWVLPYPYLTYAAGYGGTVATPTIASSAREAMTDPTFTSSVITGLFTQCNILINNTPYFRQDFQNFDGKYH